MDNDMKDIIKSALKRDFYSLYQRQYCTDWKEKRVIRDVEIDIMQFDNLFKTIETMMKNAEAEHWDLAHSK